MENEKIMNESHEAPPAYIVSGDKKIPCQALAIMSMILAILSAASVFIVGFLSFVIIVLTFLSYVVLLPLLIPVLCFIPLLLAIAAIVFAKLAKSKGNNTKSVKTGFALGIICTIFWAVANALIAFGTVILIAAIVIIVVIAAILGLLGTLITGVVSIFVAVATALIGVLGPLVTALSPILVLIAGIITAIGGDAVSEIIAYWYEFLMELFSTYIVNGASIIGFIL